MLSNFERVYFLNPMDSIAFFDQLRNEFTNNQSFGVDLRYTEPLGEFLFLDLEAEFQPSSRFNDVETRQQFINDNNWSIVDNLTSSLQRDEKETEVAASLRYQKEKVQISLDLEYNLLNYNNQFGDEIPDFKENYRFFSPRFRVVLDGWRLFYRYDYNTPNIGQLQPIANNTNPLYIYEGNPDLKPTRSHGVWISKYSFQRAWKYRLFLGGDYRNDNIINTSRVDGSGVTYTRPINYTADAYNIRGGSGVSRTFELENQKINVDLDVNANFGAGPFIINGQEGVSNYTNMGGGLTLNYNYNDIIDFSRYSLNYNRNTYEGVDYRNVNIYNHRASADFTLYLPWSIELQNDFTYQYIPQTTPGFRKTSFIWHAAINKKILQSKKLTLRLSAYDLLDQNIDFYRYVNFNNIVDGQRKSLSQYFLFSVIYDFRGSGGPGGQRPGGPGGRR